MFERYNESARRALFFARYEASQIGTLEITPEHLLFGLIREGKGLFRRIFDDAGISLEALRLDLEREMARGETLATSVEIPFSRSARRALELAAEEADRLLHNDIVDLEEDQRDRPTRPLPSGAIAPRNAFFGLSNVPSPFPKMTRKEPSKSCPYKSR